MTYELKIAGGTVVDGTGAPPRRADVAVRDGHIAAIGDGIGDAARTIDATGAIVTPGFVDLHCHYDGQVSWDDALMPSCLHGVTTCMLGNCGVGFAPVRPRDRERLIALMEGVEDIPGAVLAQGIDWRWETFAEYMNAIDFPHAIDFVTQVTHDALRVYVMGERAFAGGDATDDDVAAMRALTRAALEAGAGGFSTGRTDNHRAADGSATPASEATERELVGIARAFEGLDHGVVQAVSDFDMAVSEERFDPEFDLVERMAEAAGGRPLSVSLMQRDMAPGQWKKILARAERGTKIRVQVAPRAIGVLLGLEATFHPFIGFPSYKKIAHLSLAERTATMRTPAFKAQLLTETSDKVAGDGSPIPPLADVLLSRLEMVSMRLFRLGENPNYEPKMESSIYAEAQSRGVRALEAVYDALLAQDGHELLYFPLYNFTEMSLDNVATMLAHPLALAGLSDGGAHVGTVCDASFPTFFLTHWTRDRERGRMPIERVVAMLSGDTARYVGLADRGELAVGRRADINVIDMNALRLTRPRMVHDLPGGGRRLLQDAIGYRATIVRGRVVVDEGKLTAERPGRLARIGRRAT